MCVGGGLNRRGGKDWRGGGGELECVGRGLKCGEEEE